MSLENKKNKAWRISSWGIRQCLYFLLNKILWFLHFVWRKQWKFNENDIFIYIRWFCTVNKIGEISIYLFILYILVRYNFSEVYHLIDPSKDYNSVLFFFLVYSKLCHHQHNLILEHFCLPKEKLHTTCQSFTTLRSSLPILGKESLSIPCKFVSSRCFVSAESYNMWSSVTGFFQLV